LTERGIGELLQLRRTLRNQIAELLSIIERNTSSGFLHRLLHLAEDSMKPQASGAHCREQDVLEAYHHALCADASRASMDVGVIRDILVSRTQ
jgi:hypothetical protein